MIWAFNWWVLFYQITRNQWQSVYLLTYAWYSITRVWCLQCPPLVTDVLLLWPRHEPISGDWNGRSGIIIQRKYFQLEVLITAHESVTFPLLWWISWNLRNNTFKNKQKKSNNHQKQHPKTILMASVTNNWSEDEKRGRLIVSFLSFNEISTLTFPFHLQFFGFDITEKIT